MIEGNTFSKHKSKQEHLMKESVICSIAGGWQKQIHQPYGLVLTGRNQSQEFIIMVSQWLIMKGRNPKHRSQTSRLYHTCWEKIMDKISTSVISDWPCAKSKRWSLQLIWYAAWSGLLHTQGDRQVWSNGAMMICGENWMNSHRLFHCHSTHRNEAKGLWWQAFVWPLEVQCGHKYMHSYKAQQFSYTIVALCRPRCAGKWMYSCSSV